MPKLPEKPLPARRSPQGDLEARPFLETAMNAPLPESIRQALETVSLDDNPLGGLRHTYTADSAAGRGGLGVRHACSGGAP